MVTVHLHEVIIFANHGIYQEENLAGNRFEVDLDVKFNEKKSKFDSVKETVNYEVLNEIVKECMKVTTPLLEKVCLNIIKKVIDQYPYAKSIKISIFKLQPPINNFEGRVGVSMRRKFS
jgi:dihydroneopterin aldolase